MVTHDVTAEPEYLWIPISSTHVPWVPCVPYVLAATTKHNVHKADTQDSLKYSLPMCSVSAMDHDSNWATQSTASPLAMTVRAIHGRHLPYQHPLENVLKVKGEQVFQRRRLYTSSALPGDPHGPSGPDYAHFIQARGLVGHDMYHTSYGKDVSVESCPMPERAVLIQSLETYHSIMKHETMGKYLNMFQALTKEETDNAILNKPMFGEQLIVEGVMPSNICIGDVFVVQGGKSTIKLEVSSPRLPCNYVDRKFHTPYGVKGMKRYTATRAAAGWFCRVLEEGHVSFKG